MDERKTRMLKFEGEKTTTKKELIVIDKIDFAAKNLTSNAGLFLQLENTKANGIFELIDTDLAFENESTNKIKMDHIKTMLCGHFIGIDKLERLKTAPKSYDRVHPEIELLQLKQVTALHHCSDQ
jgi:hypothetical protein